jgi:hypothetical protein
MASAPDNCADCEVYWTRSQESAQCHPANRSRYFLVAGRGRAAGLEIVKPFTCGFPVLNPQEIVANATLDTVTRSKVRQPEAALAR